MKPLEQPDRRVRPRRSGEIRRSRGKTLRKTRMGRIGTLRVQDRSTNLSKLRARVARIGWRIPMTSRRGAGPESSVDRSRNDARLVRGPCRNVLVVMLAAGLLSGSWLPAQANAARAGAAPAAVTSAAVEPAAHDAATPAAFGAGEAERFARLALDCVGREYPNKIAHVLGGDADVRPPRLLTPVFFGCYDWHSSVHGHWLLVRLARTFPDAPFAAPARAAVEHNLTPEGIAAEVAYLQAPGRVAFERPYGLAWLLQLAAEVREWDDDQARRSIR